MKKGVEGVKAAAYICSVQTVTPVAGIDDYA